MVVFLALAPERIPKFATALVAAAGSAALIAGAVHRPAIEHGLAAAAARHESGSLLAALILVCAGVGLAQGAIALAVRHARRRGGSRFLLAARASCWPRASVLRRGRADSGSARATLACLADFKNPTPPPARDSLGRFATASGNHRYDYWKAAVNATSGHLLGGSGPGTFQLLWLPRAQYESYVQNAHSLYFETLAEVGVVGLCLLVGFFALALGAAVRLVVRSRYEERARAAGLAAALVAFLVSAGSTGSGRSPRCLRRSCS